MDPLLNIFLDVVSFVFQLVLHILSLLLLKSRIEVPANLFLQLIDLFSEIVHVSFLLHICINPIQPVEHIQRGPFGVLNLLVQGQALFQFDKPVKRSVVFEATLQTLHLLDGRRHLKPVFHFLNRIRHLSFFQRQILKPSFKISYLRFVSLFLNGRGLFGHSVILEVLENSFVQEFVLRNLKLIHQLRLESNIV